MVTPNLTTASVAEREGVKRRCEMARATKVPADYEIQLTLSRDEAEALRDVVGKVAGCSMNSPRKHTSAIFDALGLAGVPVRSFRCEGSRNGIMYAEYEK
jgi:hypothetical protein